MGIWRNGNKPLLLLVFKNCRSDIITTSNIQKRTTSQWLNKIIQSFWPNLIAILKRVYWTCLSILSTCNTRDRMKWDKE
jgi:hypothetical protein